MAGLSVTAAATHTPAPSSPREVCSTRRVRPWPVEASVSKRTRREYAGALARVTNWLAAQGLTTDDTGVAAYLSYLFEMGKAPASAAMAVADLRFRAKLGGHPSPVDPVAGVGWAQSDAAAALAAPRGLAGLRDAALIGALFRRVRVGGRIGESALVHQTTREIVKIRAEAAGVEGQVSGHSPRVGSAQSLAAAGASLVEMQQAGRWQSPTMPGHYARAEFASRGAVARLRYRK